MNPELNPRLRLVASVSLFALIVLCVAWETVVEFFGKKQGT